MPTAVETVEAFLTECSNGSAGLANAIRGYFTPTTIWDNVGMGVTTGPDEAIAVTESFASIGMASMRIENLAVAAIGDKVLTERVDYLLRADGGEMAAIRVMGAFEVENGKITAWRDYFDTAGMVAAMQPAEASA